MKAVLDPILAISVVQEFLRPRLATSAVLSPEEGPPKSQQFIDMIDVVSRSCL